MLRFCSEHAASPWLRTEKRLLSERLLCHSCPQMPSNPAAVLTNRTATAQLIVHSTFLAFDSYQEINGKTKKTKNKKSTVTRDLVVYPFDHWASSPNQATNLSSGVIM